jgi:hypothetical protein
MDLAARVIASGIVAGLGGRGPIFSIRACDQQLASPETTPAQSLNPSSIPPEAETPGDRPACPRLRIIKPQKMTRHRRTHYYFATRALIAATGKETASSVLITKTADFVNRANAAAIIAAYEELTGDSLREIIKRTVVAP